MDTSICQRCSSDRIIEISCESYREETILLEHKGKEYVGLPEDLVDFGKDQLIHFFVCFRCGQHQGTFNKSSPFFDKERSVEPFNERLELFRDITHNFILTKDGYVIGIFKDNFIVSLNNYDYHNMITLNLVMDSSAEELRDKHNYRLN